MNIQINLEKKWLSFKNSSAELYVRSSSAESEFLEKSGLSKELFSRLVTFRSENEIREELSHKIYADLTLIYKKEEMCFLKSDIVRTYPVYYNTLQSGYCITDHLRVSEELKIDEESIEEIIAMGYVSGSNTIYTGMKGVQAAEIITLGSSIQSSRFFYNVTDDKTAAGETIDAGSEANRLDDVFMKVFRDMVETIPAGASIVVPLSGGHDSRLIVNYLYRLGCKSVICYSYGTIGNRQSEISRQVAETLGYEWHFVEYTEEKWHDLHKNGEIERYYDFSFGGTSTPHLQDFLAVYELRRLRVIEKNDVIVPGHGLDILCHIIDTNEYDIDAVSAIIRRTMCKKKYYRNKTSAVQKRYREIHKKFPFDDKYFPDHIYWQERQAKFIVNSLRVYEYFGCGSRIPFWNIEVADYWHSVPLKLKLNRNFLFELERLELNCSELLEIPYNRERVVNRSEIKNRFSFFNLKWVVPNSLRVAFLRYSRRKSTQQEALNLIYSRVVDEVGGIIDDLGRWPKSARKYFRKDLRRLPYQINHEMLIRLHIIEKVFNK